MSKRVERVENPTGLTHQARKSLEGARNSDARIDFDKDTLCSVYVHLKKTGFVQRRVQKREETLYRDDKLPNSSCRLRGEYLMCNIRPCICNVSPSLCQDALMVVTIE